MLNTIQQYFADGDTLLCAGISHCLGDQGILHLLQRNNYAIERVLETPNLIYFRQQVHKELFSVLYRLEIVATILLLLNPENYNKYNYAAITAMSVLYISGQMEKNTHLSHLPLLYILGAVLFNPGWIAFTILTAMVPLSRSVLDKYSEFNEIIDNSGPTQLHKEFMKRSKLLYKNGAPVNRREMLSVYKASCTVDTKTQQNNPKRQALKFINV